MGKKETPGMISRREFIVSGVVVVGGMLGLGSLASQNNRNARRGFPGTGAEAIPQQDDNMTDNMTFDPSRAPEKPLETPPETPATAEQKLQKQLPEALRTTLLSPDQLRKNNITIYQPPNGTHLFLKQSVLELFPLFADASSGKVNNVEIVVVNRPSVDWTARTPPNIPEHIRKLLLRNQDGSPKTLQSEIERISPVAESKLQMYTELAAKTTISEKDRRDYARDIASYQRAIAEWKEESKKPGMTERYDFLIDLLTQRMKELMMILQTGKVPEKEIKRYVRARDVYQTLLQKLQTDPVDGLNYYYGKEMNETPITMFVGSRLNRRFLQEHPEFTNKVVIIIAVGRDSNPQDSFLSPERVFSWLTPEERKAREALANGQFTGEAADPFDQDKFTWGFWLRTVLALYDPENINYIYAQNAAFDSVKKAWARRLTGDEGGYPFVFVNPKNGVVTIE